MVILPLKAVCKYFHVGCTSLNSFHSKILSVHASASSVKFLTRENFTFTVLRMYASTYMDLIALAEKGGGVGSVVIS